MAEDDRNDSTSDPQTTSAARRVLEDYLAELKSIRASGTAVEETSFYPALSNLFTAVGKAIKPKVRCVVNLRDRGAGLPDGGLFTADQFQRGSDPAPKAGQLPSRGAIEAKGTRPDVHAIAASDQVKRYLNTYRIVIVTNLRDFLIVELGENQQPVARESFSLAPSEQEFWQHAAAHPRATTQQLGGQFIEFITRACLHAAPLNNPRDVAWFLASYARDALARVEQKKDLPALQAVRTALEDALGMKFAGEKGEHFFRSTLVQTIFYGVFSAWVRWHRDQTPSLLYSGERAGVRGSPARFDWRTAEWTLHVPFIRVLYEEVAKASRLGPLGLVEVLDWAGGVLNRVDRGEFFRRFQDEHAVQYFYEPFLEAYDPELRKEMGVWYTPPEIVKYQVARVDSVLREELDVPDGLADPNVIVLDPCCGTATYLVEVLRRIEKTLRDKDEGALVGHDLKTAAMTRIFGFEIMPAPFVIAHLQIGLLLQQTGLPLTSTERVAVYLTNALTGWEPPKEPKQHLLYAELEEERDAAESVKRDKRILVILGNPPYNAFAGVSPEEEQGLVLPYKKDLNKPVAAGGWGIKKFNLDDLYVRFFRLAERRIAEMTGRGVVSFISNHSWIAEPSFVVLRKHLFDTFDKFWVEGLHGDRKISEYAPDGRTSETIFAIGDFSVGIRQGVATSLWVKTGKPRRSPAIVRFRGDLDAARAEDRRKQLLGTLKTRNIDASYTKSAPTPGNRFSFRPESVAAHYKEWPAIAELCALAPSNGLMEKRGGALICIGRDALETRMRDYFDARLSWDEYKSRHAGLTEDAARCRAKDARGKAIAAESFDVARLCRYAVRPFDTRWCYYTAVRPVWNEPRPRLWAQHWKGNSFVMVRPAGVASPEGVPFCFTRALGDNDALRGHAYYIPLRLLNGERLSRTQHATLFDALGDSPSQDDPVANLSVPARNYLRSLRINDPDKDARTAALIWMHALAIGYSPAFLSENADGIRRDWPRIPLPADRKALAASAALGEQLAALLDTEADVSGITAGKLPSFLRKLCVPSKTGGGELDPNTDDFAVTAGWGHAGKDNATMPGAGKLAERQYDQDEAKAIAAEAAARGMSSKDVLRLLGANACDIYLNDIAYWRNVPLNVWNYHIGGYQVIKKWLSYRELDLLGRPLKPEEAREVTNIARRIAAIILLQHELDENYRNVTANAHDWKTAPT